MQKLASPATLTSGTCQGAWCDEDGRNGEITIVKDVDEDSFTGKLTVSGVQKYSGVRIRGKLREDANSALGLECKTRGRMWKSKAVFDGHLLIGDVYDEFQQKRVRKLIKGE